MTVPADAIFHAGFYWGRDGSGPYAVNVAGQLVELGGGGASIVADITEAALALIPPAAGNLGLEYQVTDRRGGCRVKSNGVSWVEQGPAVNDVAGISTVTWGNRGTGAAGELKYIYEPTLGWNRKALFIWNELLATPAWEPFGEQCIFSKRGGLSNSGTSTSSSIAFPDITLPGGILGLNSGFAVDVHSALSIAPTGSTDTLTLGGTNMKSNTGNATDRRRRWRQECQNDNSASAQICSTRSGSAEYGAWVTAGTDATELSKNSANDLIIAGSSAHTFGSAAFVHRVLQYRVTLFPG